MVSLAAATAGAALGAALPLGAALGAAACSSFALLLLSPDLGGRHVATAPTCSLAAAAVGCFVPNHSAAVGTPPCAPLVAAAPPLAAALSRRAAPWAAFARAFAALAAFAIAARAPAPTTLAPDPTLELEDDAAASPPPKLALDAASTSASASLSCSCAGVRVRLRVGCLGTAAGAPEAPKISFIAAFSCCSGILSLCCTLCVEAAAAGWTGGAMMPLAFMFALATASAFSLASASAPASASALACASHACCGVGFSGATGCLVARMRSARSGDTPASRLIWSLALPTRSAARSLLPSRLFALLTFSSICLNLATAIL